jgi:hypothetical protein
MTTTVKDGIKKSSGQSGVYRLQGVRELRWIPDSSIDQGVVVEIRIYKYIVIIPIVLCVNRIHVYVGYILSDQQF